ncbi:acyl-CoA dehydrogenase family protein [Pseudooceanicola batsensis HTCC2597]|uniref:Acyl-CoA dehydrogenase family protein n=1 Tax=Pseudooceanicola batsensis (strain ATCC BAA-863 / DSM 15984 / KCTC 12145 / HTCC2597) TaxID=252305 RepID=A3TW41_PSEBH|nr:acyl-CoA dehydrogenase family protein [Pseudooceanicola batsensis]EAQ03837.1 acyl-CoA dehydrogenase family protein [Pseudooceanicola batsensis HTCC2597]
MDLNFTPEEEAFRQEVRDFFAENLPDDIRDAVRNGGELTKEHMERYHAILNKKGWLATTWAEEFGGPGWGPVERHIFDEESSAAYAPRIVPFGLSMLGPVLQKFGSKEQQDYYLPRILNGDDWWCQGYSEPGAGSDLASLKTRAVREGDEWVINGQKTWTTLGQHANMIFCLVRTDPDVKQQEGISFILVDMSTPGVEVRPIKLIEGGHEVNEVFFTDVRVPYENLVGEENKGWTIAKYLLTHERTGIAGVGFSMLELEEVKQLAKKITRNGKPLAEDPLFAARVAQAEIDLEAMKLTNLRMLFTAQKQGAPGPETSILKIKGTVINQELKDIRRRALGPAAAPFPGSFKDSNLDVAPSGHANNAARYFNNRKTSIFGGSNEIQRNILTKTMLGL